MGGSRSGNNSRNSSPILGEPRIRTPDLLHRRPGSVLSGLMRERGSSTGTESIGGESMARGWTGRRREGSESGRGLRERTESLIERERRDDGSFLEISLEQTTAN